MLAASTALAACGALVIAALLLGGRTGWAIATAVLTLVLAGLAHYRASRAHRRPAVDEPAVHGGMYGSIGRRRSARLAQQPVARARRRLGQMVRRGERAADLYAQAAALQRAQQATGHRVEPRDEIVHGAIRGELRPRRFDNSQLRRFPRRFQFDTTPTPINQLSDTDLKFMQTLSNHVCNGLENIIAIDLSNPNDREIWFIRRSGTIVGFVVVDLSSIAESVADQLRAVGLSDNVVELDLVCAQTGSMRRLMQNIVRYYAESGYDGLFLYSLDLYSLDRYKEFGFRELSQDGSNYMYYPLTDRP